MLMCETPLPYGPTHAEWIPLDGIAQDFADFGAEATSPLTWQATGFAFLALSDEASAHLHATFYHSGLGHQDESLAIQGREQVVREVRYARGQWNSVLYWLERLANTHDLLLSLDTIRHLIGVAQQQYDRLGQLELQFAIEQQERTSKRSPFPDDRSPCSSTAERQEH